MNSINSINSVNNTPEDIEARMAKHKAARRLEELRAVVLFSLISAVIIGVLQWLS